MQETEEQPVGVQGIDRREADPGEQGEEVLQRLQGAGGAKAQRGGERSGDEQRNDIGMGLRESTEVGPQ